MRKQIIIREEVLVISYESFENLEDAKKINIINAGFMIFAEYGYAKASVEDIVKKAGISKGSLFYYFENKKNFFVYLYEYSATLLEKVIEGSGPNGTPSYLAFTDFFERLDAISQLKLKASMEYPHMSSFIKKVVMDASPVVQAMINCFNAKFIQERAMSYFQGLDYYKFKDGIEPMMIVQLLTWCQEGCINQIMLEDKLGIKTSGNSPDYEKVAAIYQKYVKLFRDNFYKEEYL